MTPARTDPRRTRSTAPPLLRVVLAAAVTAALPAALAGCGGRKAPPPAAQPFEVAAVTVQPRTVDFTVPYVAQIKSSHHVEVEARVNGFLKKICYKEGGPVRLGQVLFELDNGQYLAEAEVAMAEVEMKRSDLFTAKANLDRTLPLAEQNATSKKNLDDAVAKRKSAEAELLAAQAKYEKALLSASYTTIASPVDGVAGQALMREGGYVAAGTASAKLTTVSKVDPVWIEFSVSQNEQDRLSREVRTGPACA